VPDVYRYSYTFNELLFNHFNRVNRVRTFTRPLIRNPTQKILVIDENANTIDDGCWWAISMPTGINGQNVLSNRHYVDTEIKQNLATGLGNAGFCDGHVERVTQSDAMLPAFYDPTIP
jgi:prepilin-type processing-associated H-X9-DG protein